MEKGLVIRQSLQSGMPAEKGDSISIVVSSGKQEDPSAVGDSPQEPQKPEEQIKVKTLSIPVPQDKDTTQIRVVANGTVIHDAAHNKTEGTFDLRVTGKDEAVLEIFHDNVYKGTQKIYF